MPEEAQKGSGLDQALAVWSRRKWLAIFAFIAPFSAATSLVMFLPSTYQSTVTVLVDRQQVPETFVPPTVTSALETRLHTISQEILSRSRLEALISRFNLYTDLRKQMSSEEIVDAMRRDIQLELKGTDVKGRQAATIAFADRGQRWPVVTNSARWSRPVPRTQNPVRLKPRVGSPPLRHQPSYHRPGRDRRATSRGRAVLRARPNSVRKTA